MQKAIFSIIYAIGCWQCRILVITFSDWLWDNKFSFWIREAQKMHLFIGQNWNKYVQVTIFWVIIYKIWIILNCCNWYGSCKYIFQLHFWDLTICCSTQVSNFLEKIIQKRSRISVVLSLIIAVQPWQMRIIKQLFSTIEFKSTTLLWLGKGEWWGNFSWTKE